MSGKHGSEQIVEVILDGERGDFDNSHCSRLA